jgi:hypothetical protein
MAAADGLSSPRHRDMKRFIERYGTCDELRKQRIIFDPDDSDLDLDPRNPQGSLRPDRYRRIPHISNLERLSFLAAYTPWLLRQKYINQSINTDSWANDLRHLRARKISARAQKIEFGRNWMCNRGSDSDEPDFAAPPTRSRKLPLTRTKSRERAVGPTQP